MWTSTLERERETHILCQQIRWKRKGCFVGRWVIRWCTRPTHTNKKPRLWETDYTYEYEISIWIWMHELLSLLLQSRQYHCAAVSALCQTTTRFVAHFFFLHFSQLRQFRFTNDAVYNVRMFVFIQPLCVFCINTVKYSCFSMWSKRAVANRPFRPMSGWISGTSYIFRRHFVYITEAFGAITKNICIYFYVLLGRLLLQQTKSING